MSVFPLFNKRRKTVKEIEPHEVFLDNLAQKKEEEFGTSKKRLEVSLSLQTLRFFAGIVFFLFLLLFGRSFHLQFVEGEHFSDLAQNNILSISATQLLRGVVYDRNYEQIAFNSPQFDLLFKKDKNFSLKKKEVFEISRIIGKEPKNIAYYLMEAKEGSVVVKKNLEHEELVQIYSGDLLSSSNFSISSTTGREYRNGEALAHILGYIGKIDKETLRENPEAYTIHDYVGKTGVEKFYEKYLTRADDKIKIEHDVAGNVKNEEIIKTEESGKNLVLTINAHLQEIVFQKTKEKLEEIGSRKAAVVVLNPQNGEVLSLVSFPSFDSNIFRKTSDKGAFNELFENKDAVFLNRVIGASYPTGSVIKPMLASAALEEEIISPEKKIYSPGYITIPNPWNPSQVTIFHDFQAHGWKNMREAIAVSGNVYFYTIGGGYEDQEGLGAERIKKYLSLFGWGSKTGIDLPGEKEGFIPSPEWKKDTLNDIWRIGDTYNLSIGQGYLSATPLQVANGFASIVNGGKLLVPHILKEIIDDEGKVIKKREAEVIRENFISQKNLNVVKEGMHQATVIGTARSLQVLPVKTGAKTGTAQTSKEGINNNWVTAFAPYEDPEVVITVMVEGVEGVTPVATHLARDILKEYFKEDLEK